MKPEGKLNGPWKLFGYSHENMQEIMTLVREIQGIPS